MDTGDRIGALRQHYLQAMALPPGDIERVRRAERLALSGGDAGDWLNLGFEHLAAYRFGHGHGALNEALRRNPQLLAAHWLRFQYPDAVAADPPGVDAYRKRWAAGLASFEALDFRHPTLKAQVPGCIGACTAFYRHYLDDCIEEQRRYGRLLNTMMAAVDPGEPSRPMRDGRRRILFVTPYFYSHTVARLFLPLIEDLDPGRFDIHCLHLGGEDDAMTARARAVDTFHQGAGDGFAWRQRIAGLSPDVIVYLDLGMHPLPQILAALRLAPVQCVMWGHPVTTGLDTIDWFLSADDLEPASAQDHYSERLLRLPGLGHGLEPTVAGDAAPAARSGTGPALLCGQSVYKLLPRHDTLFARILARLPGATLHLIPHQDPAVREGLLARMRAVLQAHGVDPATRVEMHGYRPLPEFLALADGCDLGLDSVGWSGGMSALDLLQRGLPTVTLPGTTMRSRQTAALLERMGAPELIAHDEDDYVERAVRLTHDTGLRQELGRRLRAAAPRLNDRGRVAQALAEFLATCQPVGTG